MKNYFYQTIKYLLSLTLLVVLNTSYANTILVFGDSLSAGYGLQPEEDWPHLLTQKLQQEKLSHYQVINASISGETSYGGNARFINIFEKYQPKIVFLELGANDGLRGQSLKAMQQNLDNMIQYSLNHNAKVILAGMRIPPNYGKRYTDTFYEVFQLLQQQYNIALIPFFLEDVMHDTTLIQEDGLHPTAKAQALLMERVWKTLKPLLQMPRENVTLQH